VYYEACREYTIKENAAHERLKYANVPTPA
jgi:hypothetical protein